MATDDTNYIYSDVPITASVETPRASPEKIVGIANEIWKKVRESGIAADDDKKNDALLERLQKEYKDFQHSFPIVLRWMVQMRKYNAAAFNKYLLKHASADLSKRENFLELQADYLIYVYREEHRHPDEGYIRRYREQLVKHLLDEDKEFLEIQKKVDEDIKKQEAEFDADRRKNLYEYLLKQRVKREAEGLGK